MKVNKLISSVMALGLVFSIAGCGGKKSNTPSTEGSMPASNGGSQATESQSADKFESQTSDDTLVIGTTEMNGDFIEGFTNSAYDIKVRNLMGIQGSVGYRTYQQNEEGEFVWNSAVLAEEPKTVENKDGSKTTTFKLKDDLKWSDGKPVTADDYLWKSLMTSNGDYNLVTGSIEIGNYSLKGYEDYRAGKNEVFEGIKKIDDHTFEATIDSSFLPYYEEESLKMFDPRPMHLEAPNLVIDVNKVAVKPDYKLTDDEKKAYIDSIDQQIENENKDFEANKKEAGGKVDDETQKKHDEKLAGLEERKKQAESGQGLDPTKLIFEQAMLYDTGTYRKNPSVTPGPYKFVEFKNNMVKLEKNDNYAGDFKGRKPSIPKIIVQAVNQKISIDLLANGDIDIWEEEMEGAKVDQMIADAKDGKIGGYLNYDRNGYGKLVFLNDRGATKYKEVRRAVAYLMDRNDFVQNFAGGYGVVTNGMYGSSQWMYKERGADLESKLTNYTLNVDQANKELDNSPYKFESDGKTAWDQEKAQKAYQDNPENFDYWRYDKDGKKLQVNQYGAQDSGITTLLNNQLPDNAKQAGMEYNVQAGNFTTLLDYLYYPKEDAEYTAFNMGSNFEVPYDPYFQFNSEGNDNTDRVNDPEADKLTVELRSVEPGNKEEYLDKWEAFNIWFNENLPEIPLYANKYYTGYSKRVKGFDTATPFWDATYEINNMKLK
ncbi:MAG: ABC transporter substrate-binding protein [Peptoniphilaceae bacterium]|nr:ABC transporter substrate-binding protein [Peptoniphilaceae bacterium]